MRVIAAKPPSTASAAAAGHQRTRQQRRLRTPLIDVQRQSKSTGSVNQNLPKPATSDNHHPARPRLLIQIDARFSRRLSRYTERPNACWSLDFVNDQITDGCRFHVLVIVDDCTRGCLGLVANTSLSGSLISNLLESRLASCFNQIVAGEKIHNKRVASGCPNVVLGLPMPEVSNSATRPL